MLRFFLWTAFIPLLAQEPFARDDQYTINWSSDLVIEWSSGVLSNDEDPHGNSLEAHLYTPPNVGQLSLQRDGSFVFSPFVGESGPVSFVYKCWNGLAYSLATVTIEVTPGNHQPVAADDIFHIPTETGRLEVSPPGVLANDYDVEGDALVSHLVNAPTEGHLGFHNDGSFWFDGALNHGQSITFQYKVETPFNGYRSEPATVTLIGVSDQAPPILLGPREKTVLVGTTLELTLQGEDINDDALSYSVDVLPENASMNSITGTFSFKPDIDQVGIHTFVFTVDDGIDQANLDIKIEVVDLTRISLSSPINGEKNVALTRESILSFNTPIDPSSVDETVIFAEALGTSVDSFLRFSADRKQVTIFYPSDLPASTRVRVTINGDQIFNDTGLPIDADEDGIPGGIKFIDFDTLSLTTLEGTAICGRVFASQLNISPNGSVNEPLQGVRISVDGKDDELFTVTDSNGNFRLDPTPVGSFFVHIDGSTVLNGVPDGSYFPTVGKKWVSRAGQETNVGNIYLPCIAPGTLIPVNQDAPTIVSFPEEVLTEFPFLEGVSLTVPPGSLFSDDGSPGGRVGIAPVPADRLPGQLPDGIDFPLVITVQTDGATNFDIPAPICFPNIPDRLTGETLAPGERSALWSFNHDIGEFQIQGSMTVSLDGTLICSDPGTGIRAPGWHGVQPGTTQSGEPLNFDPSCDPNRISSDIETVNLARFTIVSAISPIGASFFGRFLENTGESFDNPSGAIDLFKNTLDYHFWRADVINRIPLYILGLEEIPSNPLGLKNEKHIQFRLPFEPELYGAYRGTRGSYSSIHDLIVDGPDESGLIRYSATIRFLILDKFIINRDDFLGRKILSSLGNLQDCGLAKPFDTNIYFEENIAGEFYQDSYFQMQKHQATNLSPKNSQPIRRMSFSKKSASHSFYKYELGNGLNVYGDTNLKGIFSERLPPNTNYELHLFRPHDRRTLSLYGVTGFNGQRADRLMFFNEPDDSDFDNDGLSDFGEYVIGTDELNPDSDGDGIQDGAEINQGTDPLDDLTVAAGILASVDLPGEAIGIEVADNLAVITSGDEGISIFNIFNGMDPTIIANVDTPGDAVSISISNNHILVADGYSGISVIDINDPSSAAISHQVQLDGYTGSITSSGNVFFVGNHDSEIFMIELESGRVLGKQWLSDQPIRDLAIGNDHLYALTPQHLHTISYKNGTLNVVSSVSSEGSDKSLFVGLDALYAVHRQGYTVFDISDPRNPSMITKKFTNQFNWKQIVANGSGLGVAAVGVNSDFDGTHHVYLHDISDPTQTDSFLSLIETPGIARAVSIYNGLAYVADGDKGLQVINFLPYDRQGLAPTIVLATSANEVSGQLEEEEGALLRITAYVDDDVQVRNVSFFIDGKQVTTDGNFPFEYRFNMPVLEQQESITISAIATDTGGNAAASQSITIRIQPDYTAPLVWRKDPEARAITGRKSSIKTNWTELINPSTLTSETWQLFEAGLDGRPGSQDDVQLGDYSLSFLTEARTAIMVLSEPLPAGTYFSHLTTGITDLAGNPLSEDVTWWFRVTDFGVDTDGDGLPDDIETSLGLDPQNPDSDENGIPDGDEDFDNDGLPNLWELLAETDPREPDSNNNGIQDGDEDIDLDGLTNSQEIGGLANPTMADTDGDSWPDGAEVSGESDPLDAASTPIKGIASNSPFVRLILPGTAETRLEMNTIVASSPPIRTTIPVESSSIEFDYNTISTKPKNIRITLPSSNNETTLNMNTIQSQPNWIHITLPSANENQTPNVTVAKPLIELTYSSQKTRKQEVAIGLSTRD